jgi:chromosome segregation ATPase
MTNKNKNTNRLVRSASQKSPRKTGAIPTLTQAVSRPFALTEVNEQTIDVDTVTTTQHARTRTELKQVVASQNARIADLEFRLEESRMRQRGFDEELKVREEITADINREIREARKQLMSAADELQNLNQKYLELRSRYDKSEADSQSLRASVAEHEQQIANKDALVAELETTLESTADELSDLRNYVEGRREVWSHRDAEYAVLQAEFEQLREENRALEHASGKDMSAEIRDSRRRIARQSGEIAAQSAEIESLRKDNERFESYSNELRIKLQDQIDATRESTSLREKLEANLEVAGGLINDLNRQLETERAKTQLLREANDALRADFETEKRQIRFELSTAQKTITEQETVNQRLASDLSDNQGFRQALENHIGDIEEQNSKKIGKLERELRRARARSEDYERKLRIKDGAIADLMQELADHSSKLKFTAELENALQKIDGYKSAKAARTGRADRITRQLIGNADGKELRFPLFRDRLSIGRTRHNDIQLDLRFVSRRHAVIATDNNATRIIDWGSRNGVYVNKKRVTEKVLKSGDVITIGLTNLRYEERSKR